MKLYEFANMARYDCLKDYVLIKRGGEFICKCRIEDLPHTYSENRHPRLKWVDEHIEAIHMEAVHVPGTLSPRYMITLDLSTARYDPVLGYMKGE